MNTFQPPGSTAWTPPTLDSNAWQSLLHAAALDTRPITATIKEFGAVLDPTTVAELQSDYMQQMSALWKDMLASKAPTIADRRFSAPEWQRCTHSTPPPTCSMRAS
jgi:polyhydroxyalkanoate synthase